MTLTVPNTNRIPRIVLSVLLLSLVAVLGSGCGGDGSDGLSKAATKLGLSDAEALPPELVDVLCDASIETPCNAATLSEIFDRVLPYAAARPGSHVRIWRLGRDVSDTRLLGDQTSPPPPKSGKKKVIREARRRWVDEAGRFLLKAAEPMFQQRPAPRSALFEGITKVSYSEIPGITPRLILALTDGLEVSTYADFEAGELVPASALSAQLHAERILLPGTLRETRVYFAFTDVSRAVRNRGRSTIPRMTAICDTWRLVLREAGASDFVITTGVAPIGERLGE